MQSELRPLIARPALSHHKHYKVSPKSSQPLQGHHNHYKVSPKSSHPLQGQHSQGHHNHYNKVSITRSSQPIQGQHSQGHHNHYKVSTTITRSALCHHNHHKVSIHTVAFPVFCSLCLTRSNNLTTNSGGLWEFQNRAHFLATSRTACDCPMEGGIQ